MTHPSVLKLTQWHKYPSLLIRFMKRTIFSNVSASPCRVGVMRACIPVVAISNTAGDIFKYHTIHLFIYCNQAFYTTFCIVALLSLCLFILIELCFRPCFPIYWLFNIFSTSPCLYIAFGDTLQVCICIHCQKI